MAINLLPKGLAKESSSVKFAESAKKISQAGLILFIFFLIAGIAYLFFLSSQVNSSNAVQDQLKVAIRSLEDTEQRVVLIKDRVEKSAFALSEPSASLSVVSFEAFSSNLPAGVNLVETRITGEKTDASFLTRSSSDLVQLMAAITSSDFYERVELESFGFTPAAGYLMTINLFE